MTISKKIFSLIACFALVLSCVGSCFALSASSPLTLSFGSIPVLTSYPSDGVLIFEGVSDTSGEYVPLFNDVSVLVVTSGNQNTITYKQGQNTSSSFSYTNSLPFAVQFRTNGQWRSGYIQYGSFTQGMNYLTGFTLSGQATQGDYFEYTLATSIADAYMCRVPAGYALRIYSDSDFTLQSLTFSITGSWNFSSLNGVSYRYNGSRYGLYTNESIVDNFSADSGTLVQWFPQNANLFGRASSYSSSLSLGEYTLYSSYSYVLTNPLYYGSYKQSEGSDNLNKNVDMYVTVLYNHVDPVYFDLVPLKAELTYDTGIFTYSNIFLPSLGVIHGVLVPPSDPDDPDESGSVDFGTPPIDGGNTDEPPLSENTTIFGLLNTLIGYISGFFNSAVDAMQSIVSQGSSFMQSVLSMFAWLPSELTTVMFSGFIILLVVGVVKVFWK